MICPMHSLIDRESSFVERKGSGMIHIHTVALLQALALKGARIGIVRIKLKHLLAELDGLSERSVSFICHRLSPASSVECPSVSHHRLWSGRQLGSAQRAGLANIALVQLLQARFAHEVIARQLLGLNLIAVKAAQAHGAVFCWDRVTHHSVPPTRWR